MKTNASKNEQATPAAASATKPVHTPTPLEFTALHEVGFPISYSGDKANYARGALVSLDRKNHRALIEWGGELHSVSIGLLRGFHRVETIIRAVNSHAELVAALKAAEPALWLLAAAGNLDAANKHAQVIAALAKAQA